MSVEYTYKHMNIIYVCVCIMMYIIFVHMYMHQSVLSHSFDPHTSLHTSPITPHPLHTQAITASLEAAQPGMTNRQVADAAADAADRAFDRYVDQLRMG